MTIKLKPTVLMLMNMLRKKDECLEELIQRLVLDELRRALDKEWQEWEEAMNKG